MNTIKSFFEDNSGGLSSYRLITGDNSIILQNGGGITISAGGAIQSTSGYKSADGSSGVTQDIVVGAQTIRVKNGIITAVF